MCGQLCIVRAGRTSVRPRSVAKRVEEALRAATHPLSVGAICDAIGTNRADHRDRGAVAVILHRLDMRGMLVKHPQTYALKPTEPKPKEKESGESK